MTFLWTDITIIVEESLVKSARTFGAALDPAGAGMYTTKLSKTGLEPATHYISSGMIDSQMVQILSNADILFSVAKTNSELQGIPFSLTIDHAINLVNTTIVSLDDAWTVMAEHGLMLVQEKI